MITVMGATGRVGRQVAEHLLREGDAVRAIARSADKLDPLWSNGATVMAGDAGDSGFLTNAFRDSQAVFTFMPHDVRSQDYHAEQDRLGESIAMALRDAQVVYAVFLSSVGADQPRGTGVVASLHRQELRLRSIRGLNLLILRAGSFFENFFESLPLIRQHGILSDSVERDRPVPMVATRDIARVAAAALQARNWRGIEVRELTGPRDLTYAEAARLIGERIGRPNVEYLQMSYEQMRDTLEQIGFSPDVATQYVDLSRGINEGRIRTRADDGARHATPTRFEDFAAELASAYERL